MARKSLSNLRILKGPERRIRSQFYIWAPLVAACRVQQIFNKKNPDLPYIYSSLNAYLVL